MLRKPGKHYTSWTEKELADLKRMAERGSPLADIAATLNRTTRAVRGKARKENIVVTWAGRKPPPPSGY